MTALDLDAPPGAGSWEERQRRWWPGDVVRAAAFVSVPLAWWQAGPAAGACLFLVAGGVMAVRLIDLPTPTDVLAQLVFLAVAWAAVLDAYEHITWLDLPAHLLGTAVATFVVWRGLRLQGEGVGRVVLLLGVAALLSVLWEAGEWLGHGYVSQEIQVGYDDTVGDLLWGTAGGLLVAALPSRPSTARGAA